MKKIGQIERWEDTPESNSYKGEQAWYDRVKSKRTGEFHQERMGTSRLETPTSRYERRTYKISIKACE
jgi:hypothetical protein